MNFEPLDISIDLINDKVRFSGVLRENTPIIVDYIPPIGDGQGYTSLELFLMSLATCAGSAVLLLLRKMRKTVTGLTVQAHGIRRDQHPTCFQTIALDFTLQSPDASESDVQNVLRMSEESICPVWAMIKGNVEVTTGFRIVAVEGEAAIERV